MKNHFDRYNVEVLALSKDSLEDVQKHKKRDGLALRLLSDADLSIIKAYGLEHQKALEFQTFTLFGLPLGYPSGSKSMAIPTSILVDEEGIIRWIDQADDYRIRGDESRLLAALEEAFGEA